MPKKLKTSGCKSEGPSHVLQKVLRPTHFDVICGRGKPFQMHSGNRRMLRIVYLHKARYWASERYDKFVIADMVLHRIKKCGSEPVRFLKREDGEHWVEVSDDEARLKVSHALGCKTKKPESSDEVTEQETASASLLPVNQPSIPTVETPPTVVTSSNIPRQSLDSLRNEALSAPMLPVARSIHPEFLPAAALPWGPALRIHEPLNHIGVSPAAGYPLPPTMSGMPFGMVGGPVAPRNFGAIPVGLLTDAQILEALIQRRQQRAYVRGRPQFP
jgi:hypothetical protein